MSTTVKSMVPDVSSASVKDSTPQDASYPRTKTEDDAKLACKQPDGAQAEPAVSKVESLQLEETTLGPRSAPKPPETASSKPEERPGKVSSLVQSFNDRHVDVRQADSLTTRPTRAQTSSLLLSEKPPGSPAPAQRTSISRMNRAPTMPSSSVSSRQEAVNVSTRSAYRTLTNTQPSSCNCHDGMWARSIIHPRLTQNLGSQRDSKCQTSNFNVRRGKRPTSSPMQTDPLNPWVILAKGAGKKKSAQDSCMIHTKVAAEETKSFTENAEATLMSAAQSPNIHPSDDDEQIESENGQGQVGRSSKEVFFDLKTYIHDPLQIELADLSDALDAIICSRSEQLRDITAALSAELSSLAEDCSDATSTISDNASSDTPLLQDRINKISPDLLEDSKGLTGLIYKVDAAIEDWKRFSKDESFDTTNNTSVELREIHAKAPEPLSLVTHRMPGASELRMDSERLSKTRNKRCLRWHDASEHLDTDSSTSRRQSMPGEYHDALELLHGNHPVSQSNRNNDIPQDLQRELELYRQHHTPSEAEMGLERDVEDNRSR